MRHHHIAETTYAEPLYGCKKLITQIDPAFSIRGGHSEMHMRKTALRNIGIGPVRLFLEGMSHGLIITKTRKGTPKHAPHGGLIAQSVVVKDKILKEIIRVFVL